MFLMLEAPHHPTPSVMMHYVQGPRNRGAWGPGALELRFYRVKIFKMGKISFSILVGSPLLGKNHSQAPDKLCTTSKTFRGTIAVVRTTEDDNLNSVISSGCKLSRVTNKIVGCILRKPIFSSQPASELSSEPQHCRV